MMVGDVPYTKGVKAVRHREARTVGRLVRTVGSCLGWRHNAVQGRVGKTMTVWLGCTVDVKQGHTVMENRAVR